MLQLSFILTNNSIYTILTRPQKTGRCTSHSFAKGNTAYDVQSRHAGFVRGCPKYKNSAFYVCSELYQGFLNLPLLYGKAFLNAELCFYSIFRLCS